MKIPKTFWKSAAVAGSVVTLSASVALTGATVASAATSADWQALNTVQKVSPGETVDLPFEFRKIAGGDASWTSNPSVTFTAPEGTTFPGPTQVVSYQWRSSDTARWAQWSRATCTVADAGRSLNCPDNRGAGRQREGQGFRWVPKVTVDPSRQGGTSYGSVSVTANDRSTGIYTFTGQAGVTVPDYRIMALGDSITWGWGAGKATNYAGYRGPLQGQLDRDGVSYDFVGSVKKGTDVDPDSEGHSGWRTDQIAANVERWVKDSKPNVVLLHIGTNDMNQNYAVGTAPQRLQQIIETIRKTAPGVKIVVSTLVPTPAQWLQTRIDTYNVGVRNVVTQQAASYGDVSLVEMSTALNRDRSDYGDYLHPNDSGYQKMSNLWYQALQGVLK